MVGRRQFLVGAVATAAGVRLARAGESKLRAAIIGHTGKGDYGHGLDMVFANRPGIETVGVADPDATGRARVAQASGAKRQYADWREMLEKEKPHLVSIAPRQTTHRRAMLMGALGAGAHVISEKPFLRTPDDAEPVLSLADHRNLKIAVMHQMRLAPSVVHLKRRIAEGLIGDLLEMRSWGKQDRRSGGEDMVVLGVHLFDLMRLFAGNARWCSARVLEKGRDVKAEDARAATEDIGPVLGDEIDAQFSFDKGVLGTFTSRPGLREYAGWWGIELIGTKGAARILADIWPRVFVRNSEAWSDAGRVEQWRPIADDPGTRAPAEVRSTSAANARVVEDWLAAIRDNREPACSGANGAKAVEMVAAVWRAALKAGRV